MCNCSVVGNFRDAISLSKMVMARRQVLFLSLTTLFSFVIGYMLAYLGMYENLIGSARMCGDILTEAETCERPRKFFLNCGANVASTVNLFRETYPDAKDYIIHSFEIDAGLRPYFAYYQDKGHTLHCPVGVADMDGNMTAYNAGVWFPGKVNVGRDMEWVGGNLLVSGKEGVDKQDGSGGTLSRHDVIPTVDLSEWIQRNTNKEDYVILKLDVEGADYGIVRKMLRDGTFARIDKFYWKHHAWQPLGEISEEKKKIMNALAKELTDIFTWSGETKQFEDFDVVNLPTISDDTPGSEGQTINSCDVIDEKTVVSLVIEVGMNAKRARKLIAKIKTYTIDVPLTLFVYGDFAEEFPDLVKKWSTKYEIGIRCDGPMSPGHWEIQNSNAIRLSIVNAERRLSDIGLQARFILPPGVNEVVSDVVTKRKLRLIQPMTTFPPQGKRNNLSLENYYKFRDDEKTPEALKMIHDGLAMSGGILSLDSDFADNYMISVFLLDYLYQTPGHKIVDVSNCIR